MINRDDMVEYVNSYAANLLGKTPEMIVGGPRGTLFPGSVSDRQKSQLMEVFSTGISSRSEGPIEVNKEVLWFDHFLVPVKNSQGEILSILGISRDITDRKKAVEASQQANKQLNLLANITRHDILNQLLVLKGYIDLSREYLGDNKKLLDFVAKEEKAANTIEHQIRFTKDYQDLGVAAPEWQNVNASINKVLSKLPMRDVRIEADPKNPEVFADLLFEKVFYNLIDNALKYGGESMKTIWFSSKESDTNLVIVCEDDGVGIPTEDKKKLFTRGFGKNTGLGLFLSREILAITGITITENGIPGKGARFEITVPKGAYRFTSTENKK
jgi:PAS domain S-box-containing protein